MYRNPNTGLEILLAKEWKKTTTAPYLNKEKEAKTKQPKQQRQTCSAIYRWLFVHIGWCKLFFSSISMGRVYFRFNKTGLFYWTYTMWLNATVTTVHPLYSLRKWTTSREKRRRTRENYYRMNKQTNENERAK